MNYIYLKKIPVNLFAFCLTLVIMNFVAPANAQTLRTITRSFPAITDGSKQKISQLKINIPQRSNTQIQHGSKQQKVAAANAVYVNDAVDAGDVFTTAAGNDITGDGSSAAPYATISYAVSIASSGDSIYVDAGTYAENIFVNKTLFIVGTNYGINPNTTARNAETIIYPATSDPDPYSPGSLSVIYLDPAASGSSLNGFTIDGDNPNLTSAVNINGANVDAIEAIGSYTQIANVSVLNNIIKNTSYAGVDFDNYTSGGVPTSGNIVTQNNFTNIMPAQFGFAVLIYDNCYTNIINNKMTAVRLGIQTGNFYQADPGNSHTIQLNNIESSRLGIWHNLAYNAAENFIIDQNAITTYAGSSNNNGIEISSMQISVGASVTANSVTGAHAGYNLWNNPTTNTVTITAGTVTNCNLGVFANNYDGYSSDASSSSYVVSGVTITGGDTAIYVRDNSLNSNGATVALQVTNNTALSSNTVGIRVEGADASLSFTGATPASFTGQTIYLTQVTNSINIPTQNINATAVKFGGTTGATMSLANLFITEDKIVHKMDDPSLGFVTVKASNDFVTVNSGTVQRGIDIASDGWTENVAAGTFNESLIVNKQLTIKGAQAGVPAKGRSGTESVIDPNSSPNHGFKIVTDNVTIDGFTITNSAAYPALPTERYGVVTIEKNSAGNFTGINVKNNLISRQFKAVDFNSTDNFEISGNWLHGENDAYNYGCTWIASYGTTSSNGLITNNDLDGYSSAIEIQGADLQPVSNVTVSENRSTGSQYVFFGYKNSTVYRNSVLNVTVGSHVFIGGGCSNDVFTENFFDNGSFNGISISNNFGAGINSGLTINNNSITGHNNSGYFNIKVIPSSYTGTLNAECNWLGTANGNTIATQVSGPIDYTPWLTNGTDNSPSTSGFQPVTNSCNGALLVASVGSVTNVLCKGASTGAIDINVSGGSGNYTYAWSNSATTQDLTNVIAGTYSVTVTDAFTQSVTLSNITITEPATVLTASSVIDAPISCNGGSTTITVSAAGGTTPYNGTGTFTVNAGPHNYTVTDNNGCTSATGKTVTQPTAINVTASATAIQCSGGTSTVTVSATGGTPGYTGTGSFTESAGSHTYVVMDANGCSASKTINITAPSPIVVTPAYGTIGCYGGKTGAIINATGGTPPYRYALNGSRLKATNSFGNLKAGDYIANVIDANGCISSKSFTITQPAPVVLTIVSKTNATCNGGHNGTITVSGSGGTPPYRFKLNNGAYTTNTVFTNLAPGTYTVGVIDANGCKGTSKSVKINNGSGACFNQVISTNGSEQITGENESFTAKVLPNPSPTTFSLIIQSKSNEDVEVFVTDIYGRKVYQAKGSVTQQYVFGSDFTSGIYIVKIIQGNKSQTFKVVKGKG